MALNFTHTPPTFSPTYTDGLFYTVSANTNHFKFRYVYDVHVNGVSVFQGKATPNPFGLGIIDLSRVLKTYVKNNPISLYEKTPIYTHQTFPFSRPYEDEVIYYQLYVGYEYASSEIAQVTGFTGAGVTGDTIGPPTESPGLYKAFQSTMGVNGRANEQDFNIGPFVLSGTPSGTNPTTSGLFLTNSPRNRDIQESEWYTLAFTNYYLAGGTLSEPYYVKYNQYDDQGSLLMSTTFENISDNGGGPRTGCTQVYQSIYPLYDTGTTTSYNTLYVGAGPMNIQDILHQDTVQYTVQLFGKFTGTTSPVYPTPTPTPTPSATPSVVCTGACQSYSVTNTNFFNCRVQWYNCNTNTISTQFVPSNSSILIPCACAGTIAVDCVTGITILSAGDCDPFQPCSTCYDLYVINNDSHSCTYQYYNCSTQQWTTVTQPGLTGANYPCACNIVHNGCANLEYYTGTACSISPTPTPTPTPSCPGFISWNIVTCSSSCSGGICNCVSGEYDTVYTDCTVSDIYTTGAIEIFTTSALSSPYIGFYSDGSNVYYSDGTSVSLECSIGGGC